MDRNEKTGLKARLKQIVKPMTGDTRVVDVRIGLGYTAIHLDDGRLGLAYTFTEYHEGGCDLFHKNRSITGSLASDLINLLESDNPIESALGTATCNAITNTPNDHHLDGDVFFHLGVNKSDRVCMVGNFYPIVPILKNNVAELFVFEQVEDQQEYILPAKEVFNYLPDSQVAIITSTSIINGTVDNILQAAIQCREVVMLGISTPLVPELYSDLPVTMISGAIVTDAEFVKQIVSEGGGMKALKNFIKKVTIRVEN